MVALSGAVQAALADAPSVRVGVHDAVDVALVADADGVHVGQDDLPPAQVRALLGPDRLLGLSISSPAELDAALALPVGTVDLVGLSPVWATPTKPDAGPGLGLAGIEGLAAAARSGGLQTVAIGGISAANAAEVAATGVDGVCVVSAVCAAADPAAAARVLRAEIARGRLSGAAR